MILTNVITIELPLIDAERINTDLLQNKVTKGIKRLYASGGSESLKQAVVMVSILDVMNYSIFSSKQHYFLICFSFIKFQSDNTFVSSAILSLSDNPPITSFIMIGSTSRTIERGPLLGRRLSTFHRMSNRGLASFLGSSY